MQIHPELHQSIHIYKLGVFWPICFLLLESSTSSPHCTAVFLNLLSLERGAFGTLRVLNILWKRKANGRDFGGMTNHHRFKSFCWLCLLHLWGSSGVGDRLCDIWSGGTCVSICLLVCMCRKGMGHSAQAKAGNLIWTLYSCALWHLGLSRQASRTLFCDCREKYRKMHSLWSVESKPWGPASRHQLNMTYFHLILLGESWHPGEAQLISRVLIRALSNFSGKALGCRVPCT